MPKFSKKSLKILGHCHPLIQIILHDAIQFIDFSIIEGLRTYKRQQELYLQKKTRTMDSKHMATKNCKKSRAVDLIPYPFNESDWENRERMAMIAGFILSTGKKYHTEIIWGGDWSQSFDPLKTTFYDGTHYELS